MTTTAGVHEKQQYLRTHETMECSNKKGDKHLERS